MNFTLNSSFFCSFWSDKTQEWCFEVQKLIENARIFLRVSREKKVFDHEEEEHAISYFIQFRAWRFRKFTSEIVTNMQLWYFSNSRLTILEVYFRICHRVVKKVKSLMVCERRYIFGLNFGEIRDVSHLERVLISNLHKVFLHHLWWESHSLKFSLTPLSRQT